MAEIQQRNTNTNHENLMRSSETLASESRQSRIVKQLESFIKKISQSIFPTKLSQDQVVDSNNTLHDQSASRARESVSGTTDLQEQYKRAEKFRKAFLKTEAIFWNKIDIDIKGALSVLDLECLRPEFDVFLQEMKQLSRIFQNTVQKQQESSITTKSYRISESRILWEPDFDRAMDILNNIIIVINIKVAEHSSKIPIWVCNFNKNACKWSLEQPYLRLFLYRKLTAISYSADYFQLSEECKHIVDRFYVQEELFADQLEMWPNYLLQMRQVGVFQWKTREIGLQLYHKLRLISHELRTVINIKKKVILNPNSYGLSVRLGNPSSVFDLYSQFVSKAIKDIHFFRNQPTRNAKPEDFEIVQYFELNILNAPLKRLFELQSFIKTLERFECIDQGQIFLALFELDGILREIMINHGYELSIDLNR